MKILVLGGGGCLGASLLQKLEGYPAQVYSPNRRELDVCDVLSLDRQLKKIDPDVIFNLSAYFGDDFITSFRVNAFASQIILEYCRKSIKAVRVILIGSAAEYGFGHPERKPIPETASLNPSSAYGSTKAAQSSIALSYAMLGVDVVVGRIFNLIGRNMSSVLLIGRIQEQIDEIKAGVREKIIVGDLGSERDFLGVDEAADLLLLLLERGKAGNIYNVASGVSTPVINVVVDQLKAAGLNISDIQLDTAQRSGLSPGINCIFADITKINTLAQSGRLK